MCRYNNSNENQQIRRQNQQEDRIQTIWDIPVNVEQRRNQNQRNPILISISEIRQIFSEQQITLTKLALEQK